MKINLFEEKPQMKKKNKNEENPQTKKYFVKEKPQMKKTNLENFKEVTHEIEFMFFFDLVSLSNYMWKNNRLWKG